MDLVQCGYGRNKTRSVYQTHPLDVAGRFCIPPCGNYRPIIANLRRSRKQPLKATKL